MSSPKVWRRVVYIKWNDASSKAAIAMAQNVHKSFPRLIPCVLSVTEGMTFTSTVDGAGAYPGVKEREQNRDPSMQHAGFDSAIEIICSCSTAEELKTQFFEHPAHTAAGKVIDPLIEDAWAMDWIEDRSSLVVPSVQPSIMKHVVFFQWEPGTTQEQQSALFAAWKGLQGTSVRKPGATTAPTQVLAVSCGEAVRWEFGEKRGFDAGLIVDLALATADGVREISDYANSDAYQTINSELLAPMRKAYVVMDFAEHRFGTRTGAASKL